MWRIRQLITGNRGQAMLAALVCLALGGLAVTPVVSFAGTTVHGILLRERNMFGLYAADAGIEDVLWSLKGGTEPNTALTSTINNMQVSMTTMDKGEYTLVAGDWEITGSHTSDLSIATMMEWDESADAYKYTITCTWSGGGECKLIEVGARLPLGYDYETESAALFSENLSTAEPASQEDSQGAHMLSWTFSKIAITTRTQIFYISGSGTQEGNYGWAEASREDVGVVGELSGHFYIVTSTATNPQTSQVTGKVVADAMVQTGVVYIVAWKIEK